MRIPACKMNGTVQLVFTGFPYCRFKILIRKLSEYALIFHIYFSKQFIKSNFQILKMNNF